MGAVFNMSVVQGLTEVDIVVGPDRCIVGYIHLLIANSLLHYPDTLIDIVRNSTFCIDVVTISKAVLYIAVKLLSIFLQRIVSVSLRIVARSHILWQTAVSICLQILIRLLGTLPCAIVVVVALVQVEAIQVVGHLTIIERTVGHHAGIASGMRCLTVGIAFGIVAVLNLCSLIIRRVAKDSLYSIIYCSGRTLYPTVLYKALTRIGYAGTSKRTSDTEVIDLTAELVEQ